ncbi:MAG: LysR family transcriptional regulator [Polyangiales bacterium]
MKVSSVDLNLLAVFEAILRTRSVTVAAEQLGMSKAAMSHALGRLREQVGDPILVRSGREFLLSERAREVEASIQLTTREARRLLQRAVPFEPTTCTREFRVHATDHVLSLLGCEIGHAVAEAAPKATIRFLPIQPDDAAALREGVDLALGVFPRLGAEFRTQALFDDGFACVVREGHPVVKGRLTLEKFLALKHVLIAPRGRAGGVVDDALRERGLSRHVVRYLPFYLLALDFVARSDCAVTMSERLARMHAERFGLEVHKPPIELEGYTIAQVWHPRLDADPAHVWFRKTVATAAKAMRKAVSRSEGLRRL